MDTRTQQILNRMQLRASNCVKVAADRFKLRLDYTEARIPRVEHALGEIHKQIGAKADENKATIVNLSNGFGAYIGEILRQKHGGQWRDKLPDSPPELEGLEVNGVVFSPTVCVFYRLTKGARYNTEEFFKRTEAAIAKARSAASPGPATQASAGDPPGEMGAYASKAIAEAKERFGIDLDYTEASLDRLDQALLELHNLLTDQVPESKKLRDAERVFFKPTAASRYVGYLSEVFRSALGAEWRKNIAGCDSEFEAGGEIPPAYSPARRQAHRSGTQGRRHFSPPNNCELHE
jgi:hypothetical protein